MTRWARTWWVALASMALITAVMSGAPRSAEAASFTDGFETGSFTDWGVTTAHGGTAVVQSSLVRSGQYAARLSATSTKGSVGYARRSLGESASDVLVSLDVQVVEDGPSGGNVPLLRLHESSGIRLVSVFRQNHPRNRVYVGHSGTNALTSGNLPLGRWSRIELRAATSGLLTLQMDGTEVYRTSTASLGSGAASVQIGNDTAGQAFVVAVDDVTATTGASVDMSAPETTITSGPSGETTSDSASFAFVASEPATFACSVDSSALAPCTSPVVHSGLAPGPHVISVTATDLAGNTDPTPAQRSWTVVEGSADPVLVGAGDISFCNQTADEATATVLDGVAGTVYTVGDNVYDGDATLSDYQACYAWGRHLDRTRPALGNHEYDGGTADGSFDYFGDRVGPRPQGWYSYDIGSWHVVVLNSNCAFVGGCGAGSPQEQWLLQDLAAHATDCTLAYMHHPRYSSGNHGPDTGMTRFWEVLHSAGAEVVLAGHDHHYERFAPQTASGAVDTATGVRQFVVGTGGAPLYAFGTILPNSEVRRNDTHGVLALTLRDGSYDWKFHPVAGKTWTDTGSTGCHGAPASTTPPSGTSFSDGFESGTLSAWSSVVTAEGGVAEVQSTVVRAGTKAARLSATTTPGARAYARATFAETVSDVRLTEAVQVVREGVSGGNVPLARLFDASGNRLISVFRQNASGGKVYVQHSGAFHSTTAVLPLSTWVALDVRVSQSGLVVVSLNGVEVHRSTVAATAAGVRSVQIGNDTPAQAFEVLVDEVSAGPAP